MRPSQPASFDKVYVAEYVLSSKPSKNVALIVTVNYYNEICSKSETWVEKIFTNINFIVCFHNRTSGSWTSTCCLRNETIPWIMLGTCWKKSEHVFGVSLGDIVTVFAMFRYSFEQGISHGHNWPVSHNFMMLLKNS